MVSDILFRSDCNKGWPSESPSLTRIQENIFYDMDLSPSFVLIGTINPIIMRVSSFDGKKRSSNSEETGKQEEAHQTNEVDDLIDTQSAFHTDDVLAIIFLRGQRTG